MNIVTDYLLSFTDSFEFEGKLYSSQLKFEPYFGILPLLGSFCLIFGGYIELIAILTVKFYQCSIFISK